MHSPGEGIKMKFKQFTTEELKEIASLIAGRELVTARRDDILRDLYDELIIEIRRRRTIADEFQLRLE
jgi:hypothetical protein